MVFRLHSWTPAFAGATGKKDSLQPKTGLEDKNPPPGFFNCAASSQQRTKIFLCCAPLGQVQLFSEPCSQLEISVLGKALVEDVKIFFIEADAAEAIIAFCKVAT